MSDLTCPYCNHKMDCEGMENDEFVVECYECEKEFNVWSEIEINYTERCLDELHEFETDDDNPGYVFCKNCGKCESVNTNAGRKRQGD